MKQIANIVQHRPHRALAALGSLAPLTSLAIGAPLALALVLALPAAAQGQTRPATAPPATSASGNATTSASGNPATTPIGGNPASGRTIVETRCVACHALDTHRVGPALGNVFGRAAGKVPDYSYSAALARAQHRWDRDKLLAWLTDPEALVPGQGMGYRLEQASDRADVVAYLASIAKPTPR